MAEPSLGLLLTTSSKVCIMTNNSTNAGPRQFQTIPISPDCRFLWLSDKLKDRVKCLEALLGERLKRCLFACYLTGACAETERSITGCANHDPRCVRYDSTFSFNMDDGFLSRSTIGPEKTGSSNSAGTSTRSVVRNFRRLTSKSLE